MPSAVADRSYGYGVERGVLADWFRLGSDRVVTWLLLLLAPVAGRTQTNAPLNLSSASGPRSLRLIEARSIAFQSNWDLLASKSDVDLATAQRIVAREFPNPVLSAGTSKIDTDRSSGTRLGNDYWNRSYDTTIAVSQLFEIGGKRSSRASSAAAGLKAAEARFADARRVLNQGITRAYVEVLLTLANEQILRQSVDALRKEAELAGRRLKAGDISLADKSQIEIAAQRLELEARRAEAASVAARVALDVLVGIKEPKGDWTPADTLEELIKLDLPAPESTRDSIRPDLLAAEATEKKAEAELRLQRALRIPDPTVGIQYEHEPPDQPNTLGFVVSIPLPIWNRNRGGIRAAEVQQEQARIALEKTRAQITADIVTAQADYRAAAERLKIQREEIQPKSAGVLQTVSFAYQNGGASLLDLLLAQRNDNEIRLATAQAAAETAVAVANLNAALNLQN